VGKVTWGDDGVRDRLLAWSRLPGADEVYGVLWELQALVEECEEGPLHRDFSIEPDSVIFPCAMEVSPRWGNAWIGQKGPKVDVQRGKKISRTRLEHRP
jgi:hypothetical protein